MRERHAVEHAPDHSIRIALPSRQDRLRGQHGDEALPMGQFAHSVARPLGRELSDVALLLQPLPERLQGFAIRGH